MKKFLLVIAAMSAILMLTGCNKDKKVEDNQQQEISESETNISMEPSNEIPDNLENNDAWGVFNKDFQFTINSIKTELGQILGTSTYTIDDTTLKRRDLTSPEVNEVDAIDETITITSKTNKKIVGIDNGYYRYLPEILVKFEDNTFGLVTSGSDSIEPLDVEQYVIINNSCGDYKNDSENAVLSIGPSSPENNYGLRINFGENNYSFTTGTENIELDTANNLIVFPTAPNGPYKTDEVEKITYKINNLKITKINVEFKDGRVIEFLPKEEKVVVNYDNLVEDAYSQVDGEKGAEVHLPHINIESADVNQINSAINSKIKSTYFWNNPEKYFYSRNGDILSVVIERIWDNIFIDTVDIYNIDLKSGKILSNSDLLDILNINDSDYDMKKIYKDEFKKVNVALLENEFEEAVRFYNSLDDKETKLSDEKIYLDNDNELHVLLEFPYMAGPDGMYLFDVKL